MLRLNIGLKMKKNSVAFNAILNMLRMMLTVIVPLITFPYTSRIFLVEGNGHLSFAATITQIFTLFASLGIYTYGVREGAKVRYDKSKFTTLAQELIAINMLSTVITYIVFIICVFYIPKMKEYKCMLLIYGVTIGFTALGLDWIYGAYEEYTYITIRQIICQVFTILAMIILIHDKSDLYLWAAISVFSSVGANIFNFFNAKKYIYSYWPLRRKKLQIVRHIKPILILFATQLATKIYSNLDIVLLGFWTSDYYIGLYNASIKINSILITCFTAMNPVFIPKIVGYIKKNQYTDFLDFFSKILRIMIGIGLPIVTGLEMLSSNILCIIAGKPYMRADITMKILAPIILISCCSNVFYYNFLIPKVRENDVLKCTVVSTVINLIISIIFIPRLKQNGAAVGSLVAEIVALILAIYISINIDNNIKNHIPRIKNYILGSGFVAITCFICRIIFDSIILETALSCVCGVLVYFIVLVLFKDDCLFELFGYLGSFIKRKNNNEK